MCVPSSSLLRRFRYTHFTSSHPPGVKKIFIKGEALRLLRRNTSNIYLKGKSESSKHTLLRGVTIPSSWKLQSSSVVHGLRCFVVFVSCSAKLFHSFPKQYYNSQNVAESELDCIRCKVASGTRCLIRFIAPMPEATFFVS